MDTNSISELHIEGLDLRDFRLINYLLSSCTTIPSDLMFASDIEEEKKDIIFKIEQILDTTKND